MIRPAVLLAVAMVALIVCVDVLFLRGHLWLRLAANVANFLVFATLYLTVVRGS